MTTHEPYPFFEDNCEPCAIDGIAAHTVLSIEDELLESGVDPLALASVIDVFERRHADEARRIAGEAVRRLMMKLEGSAAGLALRREVCGDDGESYRDASVKAGCSAKNLFKLQSKIRQRIKGG